MSGVPHMTKRAPMHNGQARSRIWQSMRMLRTFTYADLVAAAEASDSNVRHYLHGLHDAGYVMLVHARRSGYTGGDAVWRLVRDTGPFAPRVGKDGVLDANTEAGKPAAAMMVSITKPEYQRALRCIRYTQSRRDGGDAKAAEALAVAQ